MGETAGSPDEAVWALARAYPQFSAHVVVTRPQSIVFSTMTVVVVAGAVLVPELTIRLTALALALGFVANVFFRVLLIWVGTANTKPQKVTVVPDDQLPVYSILVPVFREANVIPALVAGLRALDYPRDKLDILIVVEDDDEETVRAAQEHATGTEFSIVKVPFCLPRTKPKACNYALARARGDLLVIYDAEDRPERDQLRKAAAKFRSASASLGCLQARLTFHNATEAWLSALFTLDYELWFGLLLPGLDRLNMPMPLGGTSNHFRLSVLREIRGWDPFNVTEDADLGIRLAQRGYRVATLDSTTFEEAPTTLDNWIRQRSRWLKGYMQTWLVHMRNPSSLLRRSGIGGFAAFQLFVGGSFLAALINPLLWLVFIAKKLGFVALPALEPAGDIAIVSLIAGNALFTYLMLLGTQRRGWHHLLPAGLTAFAYWLLISVAAYRGLWQLIFKPFYWEKTEHGLSRRIARTA